MALLPAPVCHCSFSPWQSGAVSLRGGMASQLERREGNSLNPAGSRDGTLGLLNSSLTVTAIREVAFASRQLKLCHL